MTDLCEFEIDVLRCAAGQDVPGLIAGAAMWAALEELRSRDLVCLQNRAWVASPAGRAWLADYDGTRPAPKTLRWENVPPAEPRP